MEGFIKFYNKEKKYGFILYQSKNGEEMEVFFHANSCFDQPNFFKPGDPVVFNLITTDKGKINAENIIRSVKNYKKELLGVD